MDTPTPHFHELLNKRNATDHSGAHPGFQNVQRSIAKKEGVSEEAAGRILGARSRGASAAAKKRNPRLNRVK